MASAVIDATQIENAVEIQRRAYRLLTWLSSAIERGFIQLGAAHEYASRSDAAAAWIREHYHNLPEDGRPVEDHGLALGQFANFFASYLETSFDLHEEPEERLVSRCGCYCYLCLYASHAPHIRPKKLHRPDKKEAERLKRVFLEEVAARESLLFDRDVADRLLQDPDHSKDAALAAYGVEILKRCRGAHTDPAVLALWRQFAWTSKGAPDREFELSAASILSAEKQLAAALRENLRPS